MLHPPLGQLDPGIVPHHAQQGTFLHTGGAHVRACVSERAHEADDASEKALKDDDASEQAPKDEGASEQASKDDGAS
eukprot:scaffold188073_cov22-Tisochrysis_lutea.AAC.1